MKIPSSAIITGKYTIGKEYVFVSTYTPYQGYYYELNGKTFAGKQFNPNALEIIKLTSENINTLITQPSTNTYGLLSKKTSKQLLTSGFTSIPKSDLDTDTGGEETYYAKKIGSNPILIKQIDKETFIRLQKDHFYQVISVDQDRSNLNQADKQMPGLKIFILG
jgi:hypothetical protein